MGDRRPRCEEDLESKPPPVCAEAFRFGGGKVAEGRTVRPEKIAAVEELTKKLGKAESVVLVDYRGINVAQMTQLRRNLREMGVEFAVVKNSLMRFAAKKAGIEELDEFLVEPTAVAFSYDDPVAAAKGLVEFSTENRVMSIKTGLLDNRIISDQKVRELAALPSRDVLLSKVLGGMMAPMVGFASVLSAPMRGFMAGVEALRQKREEEGAA